MSRTQQRKALKETPKHQTKVWTRLWWSNLVFKFPFPRGVGRGVGGTRKGVTLCLLPVPVLTSIQALISAAAVRPPPPLRRCRWPSFTYYAHDELCRVCTIGDNVSSINPTIRNVKLSVYSPCTTVDVSGLHESRLCLLPNLLSELLRSSPPRLESMLWQNDLLIVSLVFICSPIHLHRFRWESFIVN